MRGTAFFFSLLFCLLLFAGHAQTKDAGAVMMAAHKDQADTASVAALYNRQREYANHGDYDSALIFATQLVQLAISAGDAGWLAKAQFRKGLAFTNLARYDSASLYLNQARSAALQLQDAWLQANCYNALSILHEYQSDYITSLELAFEGVRIAEQSNSKTIQQLLPKLYTQIGSNLVWQQQPQKALVYFEKALAANNYPDEQRYRILLHQAINDVQTRAGHFAQAKQHLDSAIYLNNQFDNAVLDALTFSSTGIYYKHTRNLARAANAYLSAYTVSKKLKNDYLIAEAANELSIVLLQQKAYDQAAIYAQEANEIALQLKQFSVAANSFHTLKQVAVANGSFQQALAFADQHKIYADSATNEVTQKNSAALEARYQTQAQEKAIADLTIANTRNELAVLKRNRWLLLGGIGGCAIVVTLGLLYRSSRQKRNLIGKEIIIQQERIKFLEQQQQVVSLQSMLNGQETERTRIAKDLHDGLGGLFSTLKMYFGSLAHEKTELKENNAFLKSYRMIDSAADEVRRVAHNMMPEVLMKLGLVHAVQDLCGTVTAGNQLNISVQVYGMHSRLESNVEIMLYRIIQELINNIMKHAEATEAIIQFNRQGENLIVTVEDNGCGYEPLEDTSEAHTGLKGVKARVDYLGGKLNIESSKNVGTTVVMELSV